MKTSEAGKTFIKSFEKFRDHMYLDQGGKPTIGWGHLIEQDDPHKYMNRIITREEGDRIFEADLFFKAEMVINTFVKITLTQYEYDALASFVFNVGAGNFMTSTLLRLLNLGSKESASNEFPRWNKIKVEGKWIESAGLTTRRESEKNMFLGKAVTLHP